MYLLIEYATVLEHVRVGDPGEAVRVAPLEIHGLSVSILRDYILHATTFWQVITFIGLTRCQGQ